MGGKSEAPQAPNPNVVAAANAREQKEVAAYNAAMAPNIVSPYYTQTRTRTGTDATTGAPLYTDTIKVSDNAQRTINQNLENQYNLSRVATNFLNNANNTLSNPVNTSGLNYQRNIGSGNNEELAQKAQDALYAKQTAILDPQYQQKKQALESQLANQGIQLGSSAYDRAMNNFNQQQDYAYSNARNDAIGGAINYGNTLFNQDVTRNNAYNSAISAELQKLFAQNNQALNQYTALASGSQVQSPNFQQQAIQPVNPTDMTSLYNNQYQSQLANYNAGVAGNNSLFGGLFGLGSAALGAPTGTFSKLFGR